MHCGGNAFALGQFSTGLAPNKARPDDAMH